MRILIAGRSLAGLATAAFLQSRAAPFKFEIKLLESLSAPFSAELRQGAGVGIHDDAVSCLVEGGLTTMDAFQSRVKPMRLMEERCTDGRVLLHHSHGFQAAIWFDVYSLLQQSAAGDSTTTLYGKKVCRYEQTEESVTVVFADGSTESGDLLVGADGVLSAVRKQMHPTRQHTFRGYTAWRGVCPKEKLEANGLLSRLRKRYQDLGNCLCMEMGPRGYHAVLYELGSGHINWLLYAKQEGPIAGEKKITRPATNTEVEDTESFLREQWHDDFADLVHATEGIFLNDIYDIDTPLSSFSDGRVVLAGDSAHPSTPHAAMGSTMAICDAYELAGQIIEAAKAGGGDGMSGDTGKPPNKTLMHHLKQYEKKRVPATSFVLMNSRHRGRLRNGTDKDVASISPEEWNSLTPLPAPTVQAPIATVCLNHISRGTDNVERLTEWYKSVLGFEELARPDFPFGGTWLRLDSCIALHIIEEDPGSVGFRKEHEGLAPAAQADPAFIRRGHHLAFTVADVDAVLGQLRAHGIEHAINVVPATATSPPARQVFFSDPDGNGIEVGEFALALPPLK